MEHGYSGNLLYAHVECYSDNLRKSYFHAIFKTIYISEEAIVYENKLKTPAYKEQNMTDQQSGAVLWKYEVKF